MTTPFTILCFSWNAGGLRLCEVTSQAEADKSRSGVIAYVMSKEKCVAPDFLTNLQGIIQDRQPSLIVMTTQSESSLDTYFHARALPASMSEINYSLLKREVNAEVLEFFYKNEVPGGNPKSNALRISIYAQNNILSDLQFGEQSLNDDESKGQYLETCGNADTNFRHSSGSICSYVWHPTYGKFAFMTTHFAAGIGINVDYSLYRSYAKSSNNICLISLLYEYDLNVRDDYRPDYIFILGDLNYDIVVPGKNSQEAISDLTTNLSINKLREYQAYDELKSAMNDIVLHGFKEGVNGDGPLFLPTWNLSRTRDDTCVPDENTTNISSDCFTLQEKGFGWHDRIIYKNNLTSDYTINCTEYNRIDIGNMHLSNNAGVIGLFQITQ